MASGAFKDFQDYQKWSQRPDTKARIATAQTHAWAELTKQFPSIDKSKFVAQVQIDEQRNIAAEMFFKEGPGSLQSVFGSDRRYWSQKMKTALGLPGTTGFPSQLSPMKTKKALPIPAVDFTESAPSLKKVLEQPLNI